jgi:hypothetical protein
VLLLVLAVPVGLVSGYLFITNPNRVMCSRNIEGLIRCFLYTAEYNATVGVDASGIFHIVIVELRNRVAETVFTLRTDNGDLLRLVFYCRNGMLVSTAERTPGTYSGYEFCNTLPFQDGIHLRLRGTLITPSEWNPELSTPRLQFAGDLYVVDILSRT